MLAPPAGLALGQLVAIRFTFYFQIAEYVTLVVRLAAEGSLVLL